MDPVGGVWRLRRRPAEAGAPGEPVGEIAVTDADFPWLHGRFSPGPGFAALRPLFARELALLDEIDDAVRAAEWEAVSDEIAGALELVSPSGPVAEFLLHIEGDRAWFRWSEEPFEEA